MSARLQIQITFAELITTFHITFITKIVPIMKWIGTTTNTKFPSGNIHLVANTFPIPYTTFPIVTNTTSRILPFPSMSMFLTKVIIMFHLHPASYVTTSAASIQSIRVEMEKAKFALT